MARYKDEEPTTELTTSDVNVEVLGRRARTSGFELQLRHGPGAPYTYKLTGNWLVVGRGVDADIMLDSVELSRRHARLTLENFQWSVLDLGSRNGVYVNGLKVHSALLHDGDTLQLGNLVFVLREVKG